MLGMGQHMQRLWQHLKGYYDKVIAFLFKQICFHIYTAGKISIEHVPIFLIKYIYKGAVDVKCSPDVR